LARALLVGWDERIARARRLAADQPAAREILGFYAELATYQRGLVQGSAPPPAGAADFSAALDVDGAAAPVEGVLGWLRRHAPAPLARAAEAGEHVRLEDWRELMHRRIADADSGSPADADAVLEFVVEVALQPFAERAAVLLREAAGSATTSLAVRSSRCPICGSLPAVGALREEGHGAKRSLVCALCLTEWDYLRVRCLACDEERFDALPVYTADTWSHVRIDACDTCHTYTKTVDLTKDGRAVPLVDDVASVPLDLWARARGYHRLYPNLPRL
jgi:FdhE protein